LKPPEIGDLAGIIHVPFVVRVSFGECELDADARELRRGGRRVELSPKAFDLLVALLEARPRALSQAELRDRLWPGVFVAYTSLARLVTEVRQVIGDDSREPRFIRTLYGFGYAFQGEQLEVAARGRSAFAVVSGDRIEALRPGEAVIGRGLDCALQVGSARVSRRHARILVSDAGARLEDLGSKHGTWLNGRPLDGPAALADGDQIGIGDAVLTFRVVSSQAETE
jgi:DNA-binding winged helix-turn-helix (wHTH) protein